MTLNKFFVVAVVVLALVSVTLTQGTPSIGSKKVDFFLLQDLSEVSFSYLFTLGCMISDLSKVFQSITCITYVTNVPNVLDIDPRFGIGTFQDIPVEPYGNSKSVPFAVQLSLGLNISIPTLQSTAQALVSGPSGDAKQSQLIALLQSCVRKSQIGWRENSTKVILVSTFTSFHEAGDYVGASMPNNGDGVIDPTEDYPSVDQVADACNAANITILFLVAQDKFSEYNEISDKFTSSLIVNLTADSSNLVHAVGSSINVVTPDCTSNYNIPSTTNIYLQCAKQKACTAVNGIIPGGLPSWLQGPCSGTIPNNQVIILISGILFLATLWFN